MCSSRIQPASALKTVVAQKSRQGLPDLVTLDNVTRDLYFYVKFKNVDSWSIQSNITVFTNKYLFTAEHSSLAIIFHETKINCHISII